MNQDELWGLVLARVETTVRAPLEILFARERTASLALVALDLSPYEEPEYVGQDLAMWEEVARPLRTVLVSLNDLRDGLTALQPANTEPSDDVDIAFDLIEPSVAEPIRDRMSYDVDELIESSLGAMSDPESTIRQALLPLSEMIRFELSRFGNRFRNPTVIADRWNLLSELQEFKGKFAKLLAAIRLAALHPYTTQAEREVLVDYRTELENSLQVRRSITFLGRDVMSLVEASSAATDEERRFVLEELFLRLLRYSRHSAYALLRAPDKRQVIEFRKALATALGANDAATGRRSRELLEGFVRFLEAMQSLNKREVLVAHDRRVAQALRVQLDQVALVSEKAPEAVLHAFSEWREQAMVLLGLHSVFDDFLMGRPLVDEVDDVKAIVPLMHRMLLRLPA